MSVTEHLRIIEPLPGLLAFYDGRVAGHRFAPQDNWVDDGALSLGIASYAVISGDEALVYDTHVSVPHAGAIRAELEARGVKRITVVLSHWHLDHVAGTAVFKASEVVANRRTLEHLRKRQAAIEDGTDHGWPEICPLILPDVLFTGQMRLKIGTRHITLIEANIHSDDATVLWLPEEGVLLAGDTVEDSVTYVGAPADLGLHLADLDRLATLHPTAVFPNHGAPDVIAAGGYNAAIMGATQRYIRWLQRLEREPNLAGTPMRAVIAEDMAAGHLQYFAPYDRVHAQNISRCMAFWHGAGTLEV